MIYHMINIRMRRVESIKRHSRYDPASRYKCYQGPNRTWMLTDDAVFDTEVAALSALKMALDRLYLKRKAQLDKMKAEMDVIGARIRAATPVRTKDAIPDRDEAFINSFKCEDEL